jgi:hypothetical protein
MAKNESMQIVVHKNDADISEKRRLQDLLDNLKHVSGKPNLYNIRLACEYYWCYLCGREWSETKPRFLIKR